MSVRVAPERRFSDSSSSDLGHSSEKPATTKEEDKQARGHLYSVMFSDCQTKLAIFPSFCLGAIPVVFYLVFGDLLDVFSNTQRSVDDRWSELNILFIYFIAIAVQVLPMNSRTQRGRLAPVLIHQTIFIFYQHSILLGHFLLSLALDIGSDSAGLRVRLFAKAGLPSDVVAIGVPMRGMR
jgi:hypothetical protein